MLRQAKFWAAVALIAAASIGGAVAAEAPAPTTGPAAPIVQPAEPAPATQEAAPAVAPPPHALTKEDAETFFDGLVPYALGRGDMAGMVIAVVKDGQLLFAKGYGYSDLEQRKPVIPDQTLFRPGSVSKLFTWTAVMQLVGQGKLDLDKDVNAYLDFKIPDAFGAPITMRQIMSHTAGFEEIAADLFVDKPENLFPLGDYLKKHIPARIYPPGKIVAYSNYSTAMAGYIIERLSGEKFDDYIANHIFKPLGMAHSTFTQPLPKDFEPNMSLGYKQASDGKPIPFELVEAAPAGSLTSTATDMAQFMIAHLNPDGDNKLLKPETMKLMHSRNYDLAPNLNGFNLGFYDEDRNGHRIIAHAGDTIPFHSDLHLILDANVGLFLSFNTQGKEGDAGQARTYFFRNFLDRYFPAAGTTDAKYTGTQDASRVVGSYTATRRKETALRILWLLGQANVTAEANGDVKVDALHDAAGAPKVWHQIAPLRYREKNGPAQLVFVADQAGNIQYFTTDDFVPVMLFSRTAPLEQNALFIPLSLSALGVFAATLVIWIVGGIMRWRYGRSLELTGGQWTWRLLSRIGVVLFLAVALGWVGFIAAVSADETILLGGKGASIMIPIYVVGVLSLLGGIAIVVNALRRIASGPGGILARGGELILAAAAIYGIWAVVNYGLVSFNTVI